jgi:hypothetical protein
MPSNLILMSKKIMMEATTILFFLNHVLCKVGRTPGEPTGRTPSIFLYIYIYRERERALASIGDHQNKIVKFYYINYI